MTPELSKVFSKYIAVPYLDKGRSLKGWDCFGLYVYVLAEVHGIRIPSYSDTYATADLDDSVTSAFEAGKIDGSWQAVQGGTERTGDGVVFNLAGQPLHCGYIIEPGTMLHALKGRGTTIERYRTPAWQKRIEGFYRWNS